MTTTQALKEYRSHRRWSVRLIASLVMTLLFSGHYVGQAKTPNSASIMRQLASVGTLINKSSAAIQVKRVGASDALKHQARARQLHDRARQAAAANDNKGAARLIGEASREMFAAIRLSARGQITAAKDDVDFERRLASTRALNEALSRVVADKQPGPNGMRTVESIATSIRRAEQERDSGNIERARQTVEAAYLSAKASLASLRAGDTLVRSLHFESPEDEYKYEIDRNETHRMLIDVLLSERRASKGVDKMVSRFVADAAAVRKQAERRAVDREFKEAIDLLEQSTRSLVRAIRGAGVYIPG